MRIWTVLLLSASLRATQYATTGLLNDCNVTTILSCPERTQVYNGRCSVKTVWLERTTAQWFRAPGWLLLHATPSGITATCPSGSFRGWTGYFVVHADVYLSQQSVRIRGGANTVPAGWWSMNWHELNLIIQFFALFI